MYRPVTFRIHTNAISYMISLDMFDSTRYRLEGRLLEGGFVSLDLRD
jgi:hypothetical protein